MGSEIVNEDFEITVTQQGAAKPGKTTLVKSDFIANVEVSLNDKVNAPSGKKLVKGPMISVTPGPTAPLQWGCKGPMGASGSGTTTLIALIAAIVNAGATKVTSTMIPCFLKGDSGNCSCAGTDLPNAGPPPVPFTGSCKFEITNAGQTKAKAV